MRPDAFHFGHARGFNLIPYGAGTIGAAIERIVVGRDAGTRAEQDRIVAVHECLDPDRWLFLETAGVIAGPLAKRSFVEQIVRMDETFERDFRMRGDWQPRARPGDHLHGFADQSAGGFKFVLAIGNFQAGDHKQGRMHAANDGDRARFAALMITPADQIAVLAFRAHDGRGIARLRLHTIGAVIDAAGADVIAAVMLMPARHRDFEDVDVSAGADAVHDRTVLHGDGRNRARVLHMTSPVLDELIWPRVGIEPERDIDPAHRGQNVGQDPMAARKSGNVVEQHGLVADAALINIDDAADFALALGAFDVLNLLGRAHLRDPGAQILLFFYRTAFLGRRSDGRIHNAVIDRRPWRHQCSNCRSEAPGRPARMATYPAPAALSCSRSSRS